MKSRTLMTMTKGHIERIKNICDDDDDYDKGSHLKMMVITMMLVIMRMKGVMMMTMTKRHI